MTTLDADELVEQAKLAEQAERYDDMAKVYIVVQYRQLLYMKITHLGNEASS